MAIFPLEYNTIHVDILGSDQVGVLGGKGFRKSTQNMLFSKSSRGGC